LPALDLTPMRVNLLYFASFRDAAGLSEEVRELAEGTRVGQLWETVAREIPRLAAFPAMPPAAVNREYVDADRTLCDGDEVAFLPPVAGG
jgi:molybdopterin converting factor subunit 1